MEIVNFSSEKTIQNYSSSLILEIWGLEKDSRVRFLLKDQEIIEIQKKIFSKDLQSMNENLKQNVQKRMKFIEELEFQVKQTEDEDIRNQKMQQIQQEYQEFQEYLANLHEMEQQLNITLYFLIDIKKDIRGLKFKLESLEQNLENIKRDVTQLKGKSFRELFEVRKQNVLQNKKKLELTKVFVPIYCKTKQDNQIILLLDNEKMNKKAAINLFLLKESILYHNSQVDVLVIYGQTGSGKSTIARKIEEFLWEQYDSQQSKYIPIFINLPNIQDPRQGIINQILESEQYLFDKIQVRQLAEEVDQNKLTLVLIMDGYDEMKSQYQHLNLYTLNQISTQWKRSKVIFTTRYSVQFQFKHQIQEAEICSFTNDQQNQYIQLYVVLQFKSTLLKFYQNCLRYIQRVFCHQEFSQLWNQIQELIIFNKRNIFTETDQFLDSNELYQLSFFLNQLYPNKIKEQTYADLIYHLNEECQQIWSAKKYSDIINQLNLRNILQMPFMLQIVLKVLPEIPNMCSDLKLLKNIFVQNYVKFKERKHLIKKFSKSKKGIIQEFNKQIEVRNVQNYWEILLEKEVFKNYSFLNNIKLNNNLLIINNYSFNFGEECEIIKEALINQDFSTYQFYTFFVDWYHQEQIQKIQNNQINIDKEIFITDLNNFSYQLALEMTEHDLTVLNYSKKGLMNFGIDNEFPESWADKYFCQKDIENEYLCLLRKCSLLNQKGNQYSFLHKSIQEFYVSKKIVDFIDLLENFNLEQLNSQVTNYQIQDEKILKNDPNIKKFINIIQTNKFSQLNLSQQSFRGMIPFLKAQKARIKQFKLALLVIIKLSKLFDNFEQAAGNSLLILNQIGILFNQENFSYIRVKNTDLSGASFYKTNLLNSKMEQIVISQCNFNKALLKNCEWKQVYCNELTSLYGHKRAVNSIAFSPNGQILGSASDDKSIIIWNTNNWKEKLRLLGHKDKIKQLMFSPIEELLVSCSRDKSVIIWNIQNNKQVYKFKGHKKSVNWVVFSPNGQFIASASTREFILLWNRRNGNILVTIDQYQKCKTSIIFSLDGSLLIFGNNENSIKIWNIETGQEQSQLKGHDGKITSLSIALYRDKEIIASASLDSTIRLWDMKIGTEITCFKSQSLIKFITFSSDGQILAYINENHSINLLNVSTKEIIEKLVGHSNVLNSLSFSPNGQILASSSSDGSIVLWNLQEIKQFQNRQGHLKSIKSIAFSPDGCIVASSSEDRYILLWDIKTGSQIYKLQTHQKVVNCLVFSPDGEILASGSKDKSIVIWNVKIWKEIQIFKGHNDQVLSLAFSNNGILLASGSSDKTIKIWNRKGEEICILEGHNDEVTSLCFSIDDILLLSCSFDKNIIFWDINTGQQIQNIYMHNKNIKSLTISPDGLLLASAGIDKQICIWNIQTGIQIQLFEKHHELINQIAFSPDGKTLASCSLDKQIILWDITTGCIIETLKENSNSVTTLAFSPDGEILVSGTSDSQIRFWDIKLINKVTNIESLIDKNNCKLQINSLAFSPDGLILASGDSNKQISIWDIQTGKLIFQREKHYNYITSVCFSPVDNILASASYDQSIKFWDYKKGELIKTINSKIGTIYYITFAPDGKSIAALTKFQVIIWDINQSKQIIKYKLESKKALISFSPNGQQLAIAQKKIQIIILDINKQNCDIHLVGHNRSITSIQFSKNQNLLISGSKDKRLFLWNLNSKNKTLFLGHKQKIACVQFSHDDSIITSVSYNSEIIFWETATALILKIVQGYINFGNTIAISPNGQILASADIGQHINLWDLNSEQKILEFQKIQSNALLAVTFDKNYQFLAFACKDYSISIWNLKNNQEIQQLKNINELVLSIMLSQNGMLLAISCIKQLKIYQIDKGLKIFEIEIQNELVNQILFSPNEQKLIIINNNNSIQYWDLFEKYLIFQIESFNSMIKSIEFSQDGFILGVRNIQNTIRFWNLQTCQENFTFDVNNCQLLTSTLFSDDGSLLAIPDNDNYIRILDLTTNSVIQTIQMENFNCLQSIFKQKSNLQKSQQLLQKKDQTDQYHHYQRICQSSCYKIIGISCPMAANFADITNSQIWSKEEQNLIPLLLQKGSFQHNLSIK
ncbi:unnamed protein product [Paramecium sonneborni]|uniref:NACHT domain-containing protein n=1 Tax=Paramecium sonneborni TaxID=65129 RepID=A0A8S1NBB5_9CILI|nr:unnamed protein product [Paramecium sonneborni]